METSETLHEINEASLWRFFAGQASSNEKDLLAQWLKNHESHKAEFLRVRELFYSTKFAPLRSKLDKKKAFAKLQQANKKGKTSILFRPWMAVAATVTILLGTGLYYSVHKLNAKTNSVLAYTYSTQKASYTLPDKSVVQLNKHSQLQYQTEIADKRAVILTGEAYFDIQHNAARPFEITAGALKVRVLGTAFNVNAKNLDSIVVSITRGKVQVISTADTSNYIFLTVGQSDCFVRKSFCTIQAFPQNVLAWKDKILQFKATPLKDVIRNISVYFDTTIVYDSKEKDQLLTVKLKDPKLDSVLQLLEMMYNLKHTTNNKAIVLKNDDSY